MRGFTLVELVTVMMVLGILSVGTVRFITDSSQGFATTLSRSELAGDARFAVERVARELRDALPNSVRVSGPCLEYIPVAGASSYTTLPVAAPANAFLSVPIDPLPIPVASRVAVYPDLNVYDLSGPAAVSPTISLSAPDANNTITVTMASAHQFPVESPSKRYFVVADPVSFCVAGGQLWRYTGYGYLAAQPLLADLPNALPGRALLAQSITSAAPFSLNDATLTRNAVVAVDMEFSRGSDTLRIEHTVQIRNVP